MEQVNTPVVRAQVLRIWQRRVRSSCLRSGEFSPGRMTILEEAALRIARPIVPRIVTSVCLFVLAVYCSPIPSWAQACPQSCFSPAWQNAFCTSAAQLDTTTSVGCGNEFGCDIPAGTLFCTTVGGFGNCQGGADVADDFIVLGAPSGSLVHLRVKLFVGTSSFGGALASGTIKRDDSTLATWLHVFPDGAPMAEVDSTLDEPITVTAGVPFRLHFTLTASAGGDAINVESRGSFTFEGLGSGHRIESCKGFVEIPTAALPATWGRVKGLYR